MITFKVDFFPTSNNPENLDSDKNVYVGYFKNIISYVSLISYNKNIQMIL